MLSKFSFLKSSFWSYRLEDLDVKKHKVLIIKNVLEHGQREATQWLFATYTKKEISEVLKESPTSAWRSKKTLNYWSTVLQVTPTHTKRVAS